MIAIEPGAPLRIGVNTVTSGQGVDIFGINELRAAEIAVADYGQIAGRDIEIVAEDTLCSAEGGQTVASKTVSDETIVAVMGHTCSSSCEPAAGIYEEASYTMVSPSCTAGALTASDAPRSFMRTAFNDNFQGEAAAQFAFNELGARSIATISDGSPYADGLAEVFSATFEGLGGTVITREAVNVGDTDMRPVLTTIAADAPDLIYMPIFPAEAGFIASQAGEVEGLEGTILMGADGINAESFIEAAGDAAEGVYASGPSAELSDAYNAFLETYVAEYGEEPPAPFAPESYDAMTLILQAIEEVAVEGNDGTLYIGRTALREAMYGTSGLQGISGEITCDEVGDCSTASVEFVVVEGGAFVPAPEAE
ncbi:MAG: branched-chain amino acid ABC transporter substrate-binding protein [Anaerolineae bacterium]